ncbi:MAG TPA: hypothetical protein VK728_00550 [Candidatus Sulfotelmatobacter sp.]|nr:hypothetical protein [Candidatus Sulfotelmatobacter sp.]
MFAQGVSVRRYLAGDNAAPVAVEELEEDKNHEIQAEDGKGHKYAERHRLLARARGVLPPLTPGSQDGL